MKEALDKIEMTFSYRGKQYTNDIVYESNQGISEHEMFEELMEWKLDTINTIRCNSKEDDES